MIIVEGPDVDLISPFPENQYHRVVGWVACFKSIVGADGSTNEEVEKFVTGHLRDDESFGVVDRDNKLGMNHPAPLVGAVSFEMSSPLNAFIHFVSTRRSWGTRMIDQAVALAMRHMFNEHPQLQRISSVLLDINHTARAMVKRLGFHKEGFIPNMVLVKEKPCGVVYYGLQRDLWPGDLPSIEIRS